MKLIYSVRRFGLLFGSFVLICGCQALVEHPEGKALRLIKDSELAIKLFDNKENGLEFKKYLHNAHAVVILPSVIKAGFFYGGEGGNGVLLKRLPDRSWSYPSFVTLGAASFGLQMGIQKTSIIMVIRSEEGFYSVLEHQGKLGIDSGATIGVWGTGVEASTTTNLNTDIVAFADPAVGAYLGVSLEGAVIARREDLNNEFYGRGNSTKKILMGEAKNLEADQLRQRLGQR